MIVLGTYHLQGRWSLVRGRFPVSFEQISQTSFFSRWLLTWVCTFTLDLLSSGDVALMMGQVPCEFRADWPTLIFQPAAPDMIWHIYSHLYCSSSDGGRDLPSSGEAAPTMEKVSCEFWVDQPGFSFSGKELRQWSFQPCPAQDGASSMASDSGHNLAHLLTPVLLIEGWWMGLVIFRGGSPYHGAGPLWVSSRSANLHFSVGGSWCDLAHFLTLVLLFKWWW